MGSEEYQTLRPFESWNFFKFQKTVAAIVIGNSKRNGRNISFSGFPQFPGSVVKSLFLVSFTADGRKADMALILAGKRDFTTD